jgi:hypothetical protein
VIKRVINIEMIFFIAVKGGRRVIRRGWSAVVMWIQYFYFRSRGKGMKRRVVKR